MPDELRVKQDVIIPRLAAGHTQVAIAKDLGISQPAVSKLAKQVKQQIKDAQLRLINAGIDQAITNQLDKLQASKDVINNKAVTKEIDGEEVEVIPEVIPGVENSVTLQLGDKVEARLMTMVGILPSHAPSVVLNQLFLGSQSTMVLDAGVQEALAGFAGHLASSNDDDTSDSEIIDITDETLEGE